MTNDTKKCIVKTWKSKQHKNRSSESTERERGDSIKDITTIRRTVATMANQLHKLGYSLSNAFKTAWKRIKESMTCRVSGVTYDKRQELLQFIAGRKPEELTVYLSYKLLETG